MTEAAPLLLPDVVAVSETGRREHDAYFTPMGLADAILLKLYNDGFWRGGRILEPSAGRGSWVVASYQLQPTHTLALDIDPVRCEELCGLTNIPDVDVVEADFLSFATDDRFELIAGNPPYSGAEDHVRKALSLRSKRGVVAFLLRLGFLESIERIPFWKEHKLSKLYTLSQRPSFTGGKTDRGQAYGVFVWDACWNRPTELEVISWR